jgi:hypothetical protein
MFKEIVWQVHVLAKREANARRVLQRLITALGQPAEEQSVERYWKIPEQYVLLFTTPLEAATPPEAVFQTMMSAQRIGSGWFVTGPIGYGDGSCTFEMICAANASGRFSVPGVEWAHVILETHRQT